MQDISMRIGNWIENINSNLWGRCKNRPFLCAKNKQVKIRLFKKLSEIHSWHKLSDIRIVYKLSEIHARGREGQK